MTIQIGQYDQLMKKIQQESRASYINKVFLDKITESLPQYIFWKDINSVYLGCNKNFSDLLGLGSPEEIVGKTDYDLNWQSTGHTAETFQEGDQKTLAGDLITNQEEILALPNGKRLITIVSKLPIIDANEAIGIVGCFTDITDKKKVEELEKKNAIAKQVIQQLKTISAGLSYEIRSSMAAVRLGFERTRQFFSKLAALVKQSRACSESQQHSDVTIEELTDYQQLFTKMIQRIDADIALMDMQLKNMVTDRIEKHLFHHHQIEDSVQQAVDTFPLDDPSLLNKIHIDIRHRFKILGDKLLTKHVLWNLLNNALYFMREEGRGEIFITIEEMVEYHLLRFKDTAKGIRASEVAQIFEPFYTSHKEGYGLGLHFCQLVLQTYGGKIECWVKEEEHTEFLLFFPKRGS